MEWLTGNGCRVKICPTLLREDDHNVFYTLTLSIPVELPDSVPEFGRYFDFYANFFFRNIEIESGLRIRTEFSHMGNPVSGEQIPHRLLKFRFVPHVPKARFQQCD